jgi:penicillin-binding protein 2
MLSVLFALLVLGLFYNQILRYGHYSRMSKNNSIRIIPIAGPRGNIYDRNGRPLVANRLSFDVAAVSNEMRDRRKVARLLSGVLGMPGEDIIKAFEKADARPYASTVIAEDVPKERAIALEEALLDVDGITVETNSRREYLHKASGSHIYGYLSKITEDELEALRDCGYSSRDLIGRSGLEKYYDACLKGADGGTQIEVDNRGRQTRVMGIKEPKSGTDLRLTIDASLQDACDKLLGGRKGAVVVLDPRTGEVLALTSHPAFDPNIFVKPNTSAQRMAILKDRIGRPASDRAISGLYPPGSVFKVVTASAALETGRINRNTSFNCSGVYKFGRTAFDCWKAEGHGAQDVVSGLMNSCNVFFYNTGRLVGVDTMEKYTKLFGFGRVTGIDLPDEVGGIAPGRGWKEARIKSPWFDGETINYAIGQGYLAVTPIQVANMIAVMANSGSLTRPYIVKMIGQKPVQTQQPKSVGLKPGTIRIVREGLYDAVNGPSGTAKRAKIEGVSVAGKTGTAQNPHGRTHAWFCGFAPFDDPKICVTVMVEHGGKGGMASAEIARGIFEEAKKAGYL